MGWGPLDHLPDIGEIVPGASTSSTTLLGGGGGATPGSAIARLGAEADTPKMWALGKRAVSPVGSTAAMEQVAAGATQLPPQRTEGALGSIEDRPAPADIEAVPLPPPPPLQTRVAVPKRLQPHSSRKRPVEVPTLAPLKALKVNLGSTAHWVAEAQAAIQRGAALARANPKEPATQGGAAEAILTQTGDGAPPPHEGEAHESDGAEVPSVAEATEVEAPRVSEAKATEVGAPRTAEAAAAGVEAPATTEAMMAEARTPGTTEADVIVKGLLADANELLAAWSAEVEDLHLRCADVKVEATTAQEQVTPLAAQVKELEEELTRVAGVKRALAVIASHYIDVDLQAISDGYVLPDDDEEADEAVVKLIEAMEGLGTTLAKLFEEEVVPPPLSANAGGPEP
ncbi:uncharacterized protein [Miscanthus floridulus]|uniref:uncharacterized protein n=1 Tax=Miscanthus floridulus TaxID=154761 RepID=UPI00345AE77B